MGDTGGGASWGPQFESDSTYTSFGYPPMLERFAADNPGDGFNGFKANATGGGFTTVNGATVRNALCSLDTASGLALGAFNPNISGDLHALCLVGNTLYFGGNFSAVNGGTAE